MSAKKLKSDPYIELQQQLAERWENEIEKLRYNTEMDVFDFPLLKKLLVDTWQYFIDTVGDSGINNRDLPIVGMIYVLINRTTYPSGLLMWEYDAYVRILEGLLLSLQDPGFPCGYNGNFHDGYITVAEYTHCEHTLHISEFESYLKELAEMYYEESYSDTYDEYGKGWEEDIEDE